jgi:hypothetical protein
LECLLVAAFREKVTGVQRETYKGRAEGIDLDYRCGAQLAQADCQKLQKVFRPVAGLGGELEHRHAWAYSSLVQLLNNRLGSSAALCVNRGRHRGRDKLLQT